MGPAEEVLSVNVATSLDEVIFTYHNGGAIIQRLLSKCPPKAGTPPKSRLVERIDGAPAEIERERRRGMAQFGSAFAEGDNIAVIALKQVTIQLQHALLNKMGSAAFDEETTDYIDLIRAGDYGRDMTISALVALRERMSSSNGTLTPKSSKSELPIRSSSENTTPSEPPRHLRTWTREYPGDEGASSGAEDTQARGNRPRHSSLLAALRHRHTYNGSNGRHKDRVDPTRPLASPSSEHDQNPFDAWNPPRKDPPSLPTQGSDTRDFASDSSSSTARMRGSSTSVASSNMQRTPSYTGVPQPNPENDYLGFCKGAWQLQNGDRGAMKRSKEFNDGWSHSTVYYLHCTGDKCMFAGHMDLNVIWTKVWRMNEAQGVIFRWPFLAKSHVCQKKVKDGQLIFRCMFCVFLCVQAPELHGTDAYLDHIAREHRGRVLTDVVLYQTKCVNDRVCEDSEDFDINLHPLTPSEEEQMRKQSTVRSDDLLVGLPAKSDMQDSMVCSEPWNEGLSDFQSGTEFEYEGLLSFEPRRSITAPAEGIV